jgi:choice-of-anchor A domain-containing protein
MHCDIVYGGNAVNPEKWKTFGEVRHEPNYDLSFYEKMMYVWKKKSEYWKTLPSTGSVYKEWTTTYYDCTDSDEIQVFNIHPNNYEVIGQPGSMDGIIFSNNCQGKTILVNVHGSGEISFNAAAMDWKNDQDDLQKGYNAGGFPTCMTESMMWNFPDASLVDIGGDCCTSEFHGSILAQGNVKMTTSGQSGRTIVLGDLTQEHGGSEFHSYQYNPPISLPDPDDICEIPEGGAAALESIAFPTMQPTNEPTAIPTMQPTNEPTAIPTMQPTNEPTAIPTMQPTNEPTANPTMQPTNEPTFPQGLCVRIPNEELPDDADWQTTDAECAKCHPDNDGGPHKWYPCNKDPPLCKGNCVFNLS